MTYNILGRIILYKLLILKGINLENVILSQNRKPKIRNSNIFISISYSNNYISILIGNQDCAVDIEIEKDIKYLKEYILNDIEITYCSENIIREWVIKESITKLLGIGLYINFKDIKIIDDNVCFFRNRILYIKNFIIKKT